jgi:hypothetical protein
MRSKQAPDGEVLSRLNQKILMRLGLQAPLKL